LDVASPREVRPASICPQFIGVHRLELQRERCSCLRKVNELDARTGGKYDLGLAQE